MNNVNKGLIKEFNEKRSAGIKILIKQLETIEPSFGVHSTKLHDLYGSVPFNSDEDFYLFGEESWERFTEEVARISEAYKKYSFEDGSVELEVEGGRNSLYFYIVGNIDFEYELENLRKYGELSAPYASADILENSYYLDSVDLENTEELKSAIKELESDLIDTVEYFQGYIKPIEEVYNIYADFMKNQVKYFNEWYEN